MRSARGFTPIDLLAVIALAGKTLAYDLPR
jgi:hypothetical protein